MKVVVYYQAHIGNTGGEGEGEGGLAGRRREGANDRNDIPPPHCRSEAEREAIPVDSEGADSSWLTYGQHQTKETIVLGREVFC